MSSQARPMKSKSTHAIGFVALANVTGASCPGANGDGKQKKKRRKKRGDAGDELLNLCGRDGWPQTAAEPPPPGPALTRKAACLPRMAASSSRGQARALAFAHMCTSISRAQQTSSSVAGEGALWRLTAPLCVFVTVWLDFFFSLFHLA